MVYPEIALPDSFLSLSEMSKANCRIGFSEYLGSQDKR